MRRALIVFLLLSATHALAAAPSLIPKRDPNAPINITADKFIANNDAKTGVWTGNVLVIQGDMRMRANSVRLNVVGNDNKPDKIFASGGVVVDSPNSGTVTGDNGVYDVVNHSVTMTGKVVLTRAKDVMHGAQLTVNLDTGVATLGGGPKVAGSPQGSPGGPAAGGGGRVQGIFTPPPSAPANASTNTTPTTPSRN